MLDFYWFKFLKKLLRYFSKILFIYFIFYSSWKKIFLLYFKK
jgi:hypothetical protein